VYRVVFMIHLTRYCNMLRRIGKRCLFILQEDHSKLKKDLEDVTSQKGKMYSND